MQYRSFIFLSKRMVLFQLVLIHTDFEWYFPSKMLNKCNKLDLISLFFWLVDGKQIHLFSEGQVMEALQATLWVRYTLILFFRSLVYRLLKKMVIEYRYGHPYSLLHAILIYSLLPPLLPSPSSPLPLSSSHPPSPLVLLCIENLYTSVSPTIQVRNSIFVFKPFIPLTYFLKSKHLPIP